MTLRVVKLEVENFRRIRAVDISPDPNVVVLTGANAQGKSSVIDAIWGALGGGDAMKAMGTTEPIRHGEDEAMVRVDLGDLVVTRTWDIEAKHSKLVVENREGARFQKPQQMLDALLGRLSFDPLAFATQSPKDQLATLIRLVELPFDPEALAGQRARLYDTRTEVGREVKTLTAQVALIPEPPEGTPTEEVSAADIFHEMSAAQATIEEHARVRARAHETAADFVDADSELADLKQQLIDLQLRIVDQEQAVATAGQAKADAVDAVVALPSDPDLSEFEQRIAEIDQTNVTIRGYQERAKLVEQLNVVTGRHGDIELQIEEIDAQRRRGVSEAEMPVDGLDFGDGQVLYQGFPFDQASAAEQLRVSVAMAMAANPKVRIIRIENASLLDATNLGIIEQMARDEDYQVWIETVESSDPIAIHIEDGSVVTGHHR